MIAIEVEVRTERRGRVVPAMLRDLSADGVAIILRPENDAGFAPGTRVDLGFWLGGTPVRVTGKVVQRRTGKDGVVYGVQLSTRESAEGRRAIAAYVVKCQTRRSEKP